MANDVAGVVGGLLSQGRPHKADARAPAFSRRACLLVGTNTQRAHIDIQFMRAVAGVAITRSPTARSRCADGCSRAVDERFIVRSRAGVHCGDGGDDDDDDDDEDGDDEWDWDDL